MAKKAAMSVDDLVRRALLALATADGPRRLIGAGDHKSLFGKTAADKRAVETCLDPAAPLVAGAGAGKTATVVLTPAGFERVGDGLPEDRVGAVAAGVAGALPPGERVAFLQRVVAAHPATTAELLPVMEAAAAAEQAELAEHAGRAAKRRAAEAASLAALDRWKAVLHQRGQARIAALRAELAAEGGAEDSPQAPAVSDLVTGRTPPEADSNEDRSYRKDVAEQLVAAWVSAWKADAAQARDYLESALWNATGCGQVGGPDDGPGPVPFDGRVHEGGPGLFPGDPVRVVRPGWVLDDDGREIVLLKARVAK